MVLLNGKSLLEHRIIEPGKGHLWIYPKIVQEVCGAIRARGWRSYSSQRAKIQRLSESGAVLAQAFAFLTLKISWKSSKIPLSCRDILEIYRMGRDELDPLT
jgi:hypothetical protein